MKKSLLSTTFLAAAAVGLSAGMAPQADASHFRGAALVPSVDASGVLTVTMTSFWRKTAADNIIPTVAGAAFITQGSNILDTTDARFDKRTSIQTYQLPNAGTFDISATSCCRISGIQNSTGGTSSVSWIMDSRIVWGGAGTSNTPILFNFSAIQPEVVRNVNYSDNLGATSGNGGTLSYDQVLNVNGGGSFSQTPGFTVNPTTGALTIPAVNTNTLTDNPSNPGGDYLFSGHINNSDGSFVEFDWLFDAVNIGTANLAPDVSDHIINALVGSTVNQTVTGTDNVDSVADDVTLSFVNFFGPSSCAAPTFTPGAAGDPTTGSFSWDSTGCTAGTYIANIQGSDGSLTDVGTITINLTTTTPPTGVAEPASLGLIGVGLAGMGALIRRRRKS